VAALVVARRRALAVDALAVDALAVDALARRERAAAE